MKLRIVGGELSGRVFSGPKGDHLRPTAERVREGVFSALEARGLIEGARVLDLYAGTGALAFEALSRGAQEAVSVERDASSARTVELSAQALSLADRHQTLTLDLSRKNAMNRLEPMLPFDLVFADPPWADLKLAAAFLNHLFGTGPAAHGHLVLVHGARDPHPLIDRLAILSEYRYGDTVVVLYGPPEENPTTKETEQP